MRVNLFSCMLHLDDREILADEKWNSNNKRILRIVGLGAIFWVRLKLKLHHWQKGEVFLYNNGEILLVYYIMFINKVYLKHESIQQQTLSNRC